MTTQQQQSLRGRLRHGWGISLCAMLVAVLLPVAAPAQTASSSAGVGPFAIETARGRINAKLLKRDKETLWVMTEAAAGGNYEAGLPLAELKMIEMPVPRVFDLAAVAASAEQMRVAHDGLDRLINTLRPFRGLPGVIVDDAMLRKGQLYARQGQWRDAVRQYEDVLQQPYASEQKAAARLGAGIAYELSGDHASALKYLEGVEMPEDDEDLLSSAMFARASANVATGRYDAAIMDYLQLVVFHPFVQNNEARCLEAVLPCYVEIKDWESLYKTVQWLRKEYPAAPETRRAEELFEEHRKELEAAGQFVDAQAEPAAATPAAAGDETKPAETAPATNAAVIEDIEVD